MAVRRLSSVAAQQAQKLRVAFVGSGAVNFGGAEGPWDHASRLETLAAQYPLEFVAVADPMTAKADAVVASRRSGPYAGLYDGCTTYGDYQAMLAEARPDVVFLGTPPVARGSNSAPVELDCVEAGAHVFAEKPVSLATTDDVASYSAKLSEVAAAYPGGPRVISVGYMFRHSAAVAKAREIIAADGNDRVMAVLARYNSAYAAIDHPFWWDARESGGPIVEQATHFVDLARFLGGEVLNDTVSGVCIPATSPMGSLAKIPGVVDESAIPEEHRLPRVHTATWRYASGGVGTLTHGLLLQGEEYDTGLEVWCDGVRIAFENMYDADRCRLVVRRGGVDEDEFFTFAGDDMYLTQVDAFLEEVENVRSGGAIGSRVLSPFQDAVDSYLLSVAIRDRCLQSST